MYKNSWNGENQTKISLTLIYISPGRTETHYWRNYDVIKRHTEKTLITLKGGYCRQPVTNDISIQLGVVEMTPLILWVKVPTLRFAGSTGHLHLLNSKPSILRIRSFLLPKKQKQCANLVYFVSLLEIFEFTILNHCNLLVLILSLLSHIYYTSD